MWDLCITQKGEEMSVRKKFERKIKEKEAEIQELEYQLREAKAYLQAMQDAIKMVPTEGASGDVDALDMGVRPGSAVEAAFKVLKEAAKPLHIMELLSAMGKEPNAENRASIGSSLAAYVRRSQVFTRPAPNTFGLVEWGMPQDSIDDVPDNFGL